jgi:hypothetical protein
MHRRADRIGITGRASEAADQHHRRRLHVGRHRCRTDPGHHNETDRNGRERWTSKAGSGDGDYRQDGQQQFHNFLSKDFSTARSMRAIGDDSRRRLYKTRNQCARWPVLKLLRTQLMSSFRGPSGARQPGIHNHGLGYGSRVRGLWPRPGMTGLAYGAASSRYLTPWAGRFRRGLCASTRGRVV